MSRMTNFASKTHPTADQVDHVAALVRHIPDADDQVTELVNVTGMARATVTEALWKAEQAGAVHRIGPGRWAA